MRRRRAVVAVALAALLAAACGSSAKHTSGASTTSTTAAAPDADGVVLLDAGSAPRKELRLHPKAGATQHARLHQEQKQSLTIAGQQAPATEIPPTEFDLDYTVDQVGANDIHGTAHYVDARVLPTAGADADTVNALQQVLAAFKGLKADVVVDGRAEIQQFQIPPVNLAGDTGTILNSLLSSLTEQAKTFSTPLPAQAVGKGAKWRVTRDATLSGLHMHVVVDIEVTDIAGDVVSATQSVHVEMVPGPATIGSTTATVVSGAIDGHGTIRYDLGGFTAFSDVAMAGDTKLTVQGRDITQHQEQHLTVSPR